MAIANSVSLRAVAADAEAWIGRWIARELASAPPKAKSLVVTVWGDAIAPHGGAVWLSGLIRLLAPFGINERLVRTSVFRLVQEGWLQARQDGRRSLYRLTRQGLRRFEHAYRRIYAPPPTGAWDGTWQLLVAPPAALAESVRRELRKELGWEGFGMLGPGLFVRPARNRGDATLSDIRRALRVERRVVALDAIEPRGDPTNSLASLAADCWDLATLAAEYRTLIGRFRPVIRAFSGSSADPQQCFIVRTLLIHAFRRVTLHDPQLPRELLPSRWPAAAAYALCRDFYRTTHKSAEKHLCATLQTERGALPPAAPYFYDRFGGLTS